MKQSIKFDGSDDTLYIDGEIVDATVFDKCLTMAEWHHCVQVHSTEPEQSA